MTQQPAGQAGHALQQPIRQFSGSHDFIVKGLDGFGRLPQLAEALQQARATALATLELFDKVVMGHHADEEQELFVSVLRSCRDEPETARVHRLVNRLASEHRQIEAMWHRVRSAVAQTAAGKVHAMAEFEDDVVHLVALYRDHAQLEERVFLPLADQILGRNSDHMAALDIALHLRHTPPPRCNYI